jgi:murein DD-endopeptidase MepM/ murein hydrolase activator NlpD
LKKISQVCILIILILGLVQPVFAQESSPEGLIYIVKSGDTLWTIARRLHIYYDELLTLNGITEESSILPGTELMIPSSGEMRGVLSTTRITYGESLQSISRRYGVSEADLIQLNRLTSPVELYVGVSVVLINEEENTDQNVRRVSLAPEQSSLELAIEKNLNPWTIVTANSQDGEWDLIPGEVFFVPGDGDDGPGAFPGEISKIKYSPEAFIQGHTYVLRVNAPEETEVVGALGEYPLHFFSNGDRSYLALQGLHAKENLGFKPLSISGTLPDGTPFAHTQMVQVISGNYPYEEILDVPMATVSLEITEEETTKLEEIVAPATANKFWDGVFAAPVPAELSLAYASYYGNRRSFNGSGYYYFHSGLDYYSLMGGDIYAPAPGKVVFIGDFPIHGNTTILNHGWGIYTLYAHQSEFLVREGDKVTTGELIGRVGSTGRSSGPHLHWEVWVGGIPVDPLDWVEESYP